MTKLVSHRRTGAAADKLRTGTSSVNNADAFMALMKASCRLSAKREKGLRGQHSRKPQARSNSQRGVLPEGSGASPPPLALSAQVAQGLILAGTACSLFRDAVDERETSKPSNVGMIMQLTRRQFLSKTATAVIVAGT